MSNDISVNKNEFAYKSIKDAIITGVVSNESPISENIFVEKLKISRTPIRAALQKLQYENFIKIVPNQGIIINELTLKEANQLFDLRITLETFMLEQTIPFVTDGDIKELNECLDEQTKILKSGNINNFFKADLKFHALTYKYYDNEQMKGIVENCRGRFAAYHQKSFSRKNRIEIVIGEHKAIVNAIGKKDISNAKKLLYEHVSNGVMALLRMR